MGSCISFVSIQGLGAVNWIEERFHVELGCLWISKSSYKLFPGLVQGQTRPADGANGMCRSVYVISEAKG